VLTSTTSWPFEAFAKPGCSLLLHLLWCRHKILYVYQQSRLCVNQAKQLYGSSEQYTSNFRQINETPNRRSPLINLHAELQQVELDYTNYLDYLTEHENTIAINYINYKTYLEKLEKLPCTKLSFCQEFLRHVGNKFQRQIQVDRDSQRIGRDRLQRLKATVWESITTEPIASEPWSGQGSGEQECKSALALQKELHYYGNNTLKSKMPGIPPEINPRLRQALSDCAQFQSHDRLFNFFNANEPLKPWRDDLPEVNNRAERAERVIGFLVEQKRSNTQENVLLILLSLLKDQIDQIMPLHQTLSGLLQELAPILSGYSSNSNIVPFPTKTHTNSESLLRAELALQANPKGEPMRYIVTDEKRLNCARSVARISVPQIVSGNMKKIPTGTGWLVTPNLALTCWHVIKARGSNSGSIPGSDLKKQIENGLFTFDFTQPGEGIEYGIDRLEHEDVNLDYVLLRLRDRPDSPLKKWGFLELDTDVPLTLQTQLYVIQHPKGQPQQRSGGFFVKPASDTKILHNAPTEPGTSGAPVLNVTNFRVVALHNGENEAENLREATTIKAILVDLKQHRPELYDEIVAIQNLKQE
jgi:V8-like Glu-specific endopeptidase